MKKEKRGKVADKSRDVKLMARSYEPYEIGGILEDLLQDYKYFSSGVSTGYGSPLAKVKKEMLFWSSVKELQEKQKKEVGGELEEAFSITDYSYYQDLYFKESKRVTKLAIYGVLTTLIIIFLLIDKITL